MLWLIFFFEDAQKDIYLSVVVFVLMVLLLEKFFQTLMRRSWRSKESEQIVQKVGGMVENISHFIHLSVFPARFIMNLIEMLPLSSPPYSNFTIPLRKFQNSFPSMWHWSFPVEKQLFSLPLWPLPWNNTQQGHKKETMKNEVMEFWRYERSLPHISYHRQKPKNVSSVLLTLCRLLILQRFSVDSRALGALAKFAV